MEHAAMLHLLMFMGAPHLPKIIDFSIDYLRAGHYRDTFAACQVWRQGRRVANVAITAWQTHQAEPIATARCHFKLDDPCRIRQGGVAVCGVTLCDCVTEHRNRAPPGTHASLPAH